MRPIKPKRTEQKDSYGNGKIQINPRSLHVTRENINLFRKRGQRADISRSSTYEDLKATKGDYNA